MRPPATAIHRQRGLTLVELMIALVLGLLVIAAATAVYLSNRRAYTVNSALSTIQSNARIAYELIARDIRQAGTTGCGNFGNTAVDSLLTNGPAAAAPDWYADVDSTHPAVQGFDPGTSDPALTSGTARGQRVAGTSSLHLIGAGAPTATLTTVTGPSSANIAAGSGTLQQGDIVVLCAPLQANVLQLSQYVAGTTPSVTFTATGLNSKAPNMPTFGRNALLSRLSASIWYIGYNARGKKSLYRLTLVNQGGAPKAVEQEMVRGVSDMQIKYLQSGANAYTTASAVGTAWANVSAVHLTLTLVSRNAHAGTDQKAITRPVSGIVALRNAP